MSDAENLRPDPDALLRSLEESEAKERRGRLKIFLGMCAGVGKTYDMLRAGQEARLKGIDTVVGFVETHGRKDTEALVAGLEVIPRRRITYKDAEIEEMDLDAILARRPKLALIDELAHTNAEGSRHKKRYQDVVELLDNGIDVATTVNIQHLESRADTVAQITGSIVRETVPDSVFEAAEQVELVDLTPDELLKRLAEGKVYTPERSKRAVQHFFRKGNLTALREMALRLTAESVDKQLRQYMRGERISGPWKSGERMMVLLTPGEESVRLIRWARRASQTLNASWIALHVETSHPLSDVNHERLAKNTKLAQELGAEVISTADEDEVTAILRVAREQNVTQILAAKDPPFSIFRRRFLARLLSQSGNVDVLVLGNDREGAPTPPTSIVPVFHSGLAQYAAAVGTILVVALACFVAGDIIGYQSVSMILLFAVALLPLRLGAGPVLVAAALSAVVYNFFFIPPIFTFFISATRDFLMLGAFFLVAAVTGVLSARVRARERTVRIREERATALYNLTKDLTTAKNQDEVVEAAVRNLQRFFGAEIVAFVAETDGDIFTKAHPASTMSVDEKEFGVASWVYWNEKRAGRFTETLPFARATYFPLSGPRYPLGVIGVRLPQSAAPSIDQETLLENFVTQIASSMEREFLNTIAKRTIVLEESERLYKTLFDSVSHELRTPIATIMSASENLLTQKAQHHRAIAEEIHTAGERLNRLVENLLDMTRLESGLITPRLDWCDLHDLVRSAIQKVEGQLREHIITTDVPEQLPLVRVDVGLLEQALVNLLLNASLYTPAGTSILVSARVDGMIVLRVSDNGPGIPPESLQRLFDKFYRVPGSRTGGTGLGLSIARGFVEAHHGILTAENRPEGGARLTISIPHETQTDHPDH